METPRERSNPGRPDDPPLDPQEQKVVSLRIKIRQAEMIRDLAEESFDGNYEAFVASLRAFHTEGDRRYQDQIDADIASFSQDNQDTDPLEAEQLSKELYALSQQVKRLTDTRDRLVAENAKLESQLSHSSQKLESDINDD
jgi:septal ring factor EnvC (AmiA/AmiB activator)